LVAELSNRRAAFSWALPRILVIIIIIIIKKFNRYSVIKTQKEAVGLRMNDTMSTLKDAKAISTHRRLKFTRSLLYVPSACDASS